MEKALGFINKLQSAGVLKAYAIGGGVAATYYIEPVLTYDLDIFFIPMRESLDILTPIYDYAKKKGYPTRKEMILIEGIPVQFIPAYNKLVQEAVEKADVTTYKKAPTRVVKPEYLAAIALQTGRPKDMERMIRLLDEAAVDPLRLSDILGRFNLSAKYGEFKRKFYGQKGR